MPIDMKTLTEEARKQITEISPEEAQAHLDDGGVVIDVREPQEYDEAHVPGALNIPRGVIEIKVPGHEDIPASDTSICVYCGSGGRAALSAQRLQEMGYTKVTSIEGGIKAWQAGGHTTESTGGSDEEE